jgi:preprotein translocase subunit SecA
VAAALQKAAERMLGVNDLYDPQDPWAHYITNALKAKELFIRDVNDIVRGDEVVIVDEFTGRVMPGRRWSDGQHQAIEAKEELPIQPETQTLASITDQNFFLLYPRLAGMTGTAKTEDVEFEKTYKFEVTIVPTNRRSQRGDWTGQVYKSGAAKWRLSLEDNLLRIFCGDRVAGLMHAFRVEEDMPIESGMLTRSLEGTQKKVEPRLSTLRRPSSGGESGRSQLSTSAWVGG